VGESEIQDSLQGEQPSFCLRSQPVYEFPLDFWLIL